MYKSKPSEFRMAIEEAFLAEHGFADTLLVDEVNIAERQGHHDSVPIQEATDSNQEQECHWQSQASYLKSPWCTEILGTGHLGRIHIL